MALHDFFQKEGFLYLQAPIFTASDCEGAGEMFQAITQDLEEIARTGKVDYSKDFFGKKVGLTVSTQFEAETFAQAFSKVYTFGPTFRADKSHTPYHLAEFWQIEPEVALEGTNNRFPSRFLFVEEQVHNSGKNWQDFTLEELDKFWDEAKKQDEKGIYELYQNVRILRQGIEELGITDNHLKMVVNPMTLGFKLMLLLILLPLWIFSWWPSMPVYWIPMSIFKAKMKDPMFEGTLLYGSAVLFTLPVFSLITLLVVGCTIGWLSAIVYVALFPLLMLFCWKYAMCAKRTYQSLQCLLKPSSVDCLKRMRKSLHEKLNNVLKK